MFQFSTVFDPGCGECLKIRLRSFFLPDLEESPDVCMISLPLVGLLHDTHPLPKISRFRSDGI